MIRRTTCTQSIGWLIVFSIAVLPLRAGDLRKIAEIDLKESIKEFSASEIGEPTVFALRFSPDGRSVAVVIEEYELRGSGRARNHLLIVPIPFSKSSIQQFEIDFGATDLEDINRWPSLAWTAAGDAVLAGGELVRIGEKRPCSSAVGDGSSGAKGLRTETSSVDPGELARSLLLDGVCGKQEPWQFNSEWTIEDVSVERRLLCVSQPIRSVKDPVAAEEARIAGRLNEILIVDPRAGRVLQRFGPGVLSDGDLKFGDGGHVVCEGKQASVPSQVPVRCWSVETARQVVEAKNINGGAPIAVAAQSARAVASDYRHLEDPFSLSYKEVLRRRVVWDLRTGKELASWRPELQPYDIGMKPVKKAWCAFAISPDGQYVVDGGNGVLRLYKIEP